MSESLESEGCLQRQSVERASGNGETHKICLPSGPGTLSQTQETDSAL